MTDDRNTIYGWVLFSGVVALGLSALSARVFESEEPEEEGYFIEAVEEGGAEDSGPSLATLLSTGSASAGEAVFAKCQACHTIAQGAPNGIGPNLYGVVGEPIGAGRGFAFSSALSGHGGQWDYQNLSDWLENPRAFASGTKMSFAGLSSAEDRANVILYLRENGGGPPLPEPEPEPEVADNAVEGEDGAGEGPGTVEGGEAQPEAEVGAMSAPQPVPGESTRGN